MILRPYFQLEVLTQGLYDKLELHVFSFSCLFTLQCRGLHLVSSQSSNFGLLFGIYLHI